MCGVPSGLRKGQGAFLVTAFHSSLFRQIPMTGRLHVGAPKCRHCGESLTWEDAHPFVGLAASAITVWCRP